MHTTTVEPQVLIARLERKFERKVRIHEERKRSREMRRTLSQFEGLNPGTLSQYYEV